MINVSSQIIIHTNIIFHYIRYHRSRHAHDCYVQKVSTCCHRQFFASHFTSRFFLHIYKNIYIFYICVLLLVKLFGCSATGNLRLSHVFVLIVAIVVTHSFIHSFIHSLILSLHHPQRVSAISATEQLSVVRNVHSRCRLLHSID
jgi:hypothetical protein